MDCVPATSGGGAERPEGTLFIGGQDASTHHLHLPSRWDRVSDFHFSLNHNLVHMLSRQLKKAGLHKCQALQWLPEASRNVVTDFEVTLRFTPDATAKQAALVADGLRDEVQQLLNTHDVQAEFRVQCFIAVYFAATSKDGSVKSSNDPGHRFDLVN